MPLLSLRVRADRLTAPHSNFLHMQCVPTNMHGCDTWDELSCCRGLDLPPDVCTNNGKGSGVCLPS